MTDKMRKLANSFSNTSYKSELFKVAKSIVSRAMDALKGMNRSSPPPEVLLGKGVLEICSKFTGEHPCQNVISTVLSNFIEIAL